MQTRDEPGGGEHVWGHARHSRAHSGPRHYRHSRLRQLRADIVLKVIFVFRNFFMNWMLILGRGLTGIPAFANWEQRYFWKSSLYSGILGRGITGIPAFANWEQRYFWKSSLYSGIWAAALPAFPPSPTESSDIFESRLCSSALF